MLTQKAKDKFNHWSTNWTETMEHFPTFYHFGSKCKRIVEFGVLRGVSTWAWVASDPDYLRAVDIINHNVEHKELEEECAAMGMDYKFVIGDVGHGALRKIESTFNRVSYKPEETGVDPYVMDEGIELLYIDTYHSYTQCKAELTIHGDRVSKYILFHDTADTAYGERHDYDGDKGLNFAIREFLAENPHWVYLHKIEYSYGMTVLGNTKNVTDVPNMDPNFRYPAVTL